MRLVRRTVPGPSARTDPDLLPPVSPSTRPRSPTHLNQPRSGRRRHPPRHGGRRSGCRLAADASAFTAAGETSKIQIVIAPSGRARLSIERLGALEIPASLDWLHDTTASMLPRVDLPELLLEVHAWTGFLDAYVHVSGADARLKDLAVSVAASLTAEACNVGLVAVTDPEIEALTRPPPWQGPARSSSPGCGTAPRRRVDPSLDGTVALRRRVVSSPGKRRSNFPGLD